MNAVIGIKEASSEFAYYFFISFIIEFTIFYIIKEIEFIFVIIKVTVYIVSFIFIIDHIRILSIGLELACNGG